MRRLLALLVVLGLLAASCSSSGTDAASDASDAPTTSTTDAAQAEDPSSTTEAGDVATTDPDDVATTTSTTGAPRVDACVTERPAEVGLQSEALESGGVEYRYQWTLPSTYDGTPLAVVLDFHPIGFSGPVQAQISGMAELAESEGFLAVQPTGPPGNGDDRNVWELSQFDEPDRDDVAFVSDLLDRLGSNVCIDRDRIFAIGMSSGSLFTSNLVCRFSEHLAAAVSVAGVTHDDGCEPSQAVPYLAFHGTADTTIPFDGSGQSTLDGAEAAGDFFTQVMPDEFAEFAADFGCTDPIDTPVTEKVSVRTWPGCVVELAFYTVVDGGHTWPNSELFLSIDPENTTTELDATAIAWEFFQRHGA